MWTYTSIKEPDANYITDTSFIGGEGKTGSFVQVVDLSGTAYQISSLDGWTNNAFQLFRSSKEFSQFTLIKNERTSLSGYPAQRIEYTAVSNTGTRYGLLNI